MRNAYSFLDSIFRFGFGAWYIIYIIRNNVNCAILIYHIGKSSSINDCFRYKIIVFCIQYKVLIACSIFC